ncbi:MAG TPA: hypothetical protein VEA61_06480 [Allosphingosinicella sp.]|nr:hypothetical protein [Allosphingosinicella sp.]
MELQFTSDAAVGDAELVVSLDLEGLGALMAAIERALATGSGELIPRAEDGRGPGGEPSSRAFRKVTLAFAGPPRGAERRPAAG